MSAHTNKHANQPLKSTLNSKNFASIHFPNKKKLQKSKGVSGTSWLLGLKKILDDEDDSDLDNSVRSSHVSFKNLSLDHGK